MQTRALGRSDLLVTPLAFGTWLTAAGGIAREQAIRCIHAAVDLGINLFDTANEYGAGEAERVLGEALRGRDRSRLLVATKLFFPVGDEPGRGLSRAQVEWQLERSLERLGVECIDLYQCHRWDAEVPVAETIEALERARQAGKIRAYGFSEWTGAQIDEAAKAATELGAEGFISSQPQYSILWRKPERVSFAACRRHGVGSIVFSPLAHGVLSGKYRPGEPPPAGSRAASAEMNRYMETAGRRYRSDDLLRAVQELEPVARDLGCTMAQMAVAWTLRRPEVAAAILGASRPEQLEDNVRALEVKLTDEVLARIDQAVESVVVWE